MKKNRHMISIGVLMLLLFSGIAWFTFQKSNEIIESGYLASEGSGAENFAVLTAANIHLTDAQVQKLKAYDYKELQMSEENEELRRMMASEGFTRKVDYAYVMVHLPEGETPYQVDDDNAAFFGAPKGTPLDILWLLDVNVSPGADEQSQSDWNAVENNELKRYSYFIAEDEKIFNESPTFILNKSEWGDHICGYAPLYSTEGTYIGVVGVELQTADYHSYRNKALFGMAILLFISTATLLIMFVILYFQYRKLQFEKIYTDPLTKVRNRSYYNDRFIRYVNQLHHRGEGFALMIADVDFFKKVNDTFGHDVGDQVLIELGEALVDQFGIDHVVRFGGEEFVIGLWVKNQDAIRTQLDLLYRTISERKFSTRQIDISISLGCAYKNTEELNGWLASGMLRAADCNLYQVKESGRKHYRIVAYDENADYQK